MPDHQRGQAFGVASTALKTSQGLGILLAGLLAERLTPSLSLAVMGAAGVLVAIAAGAAWRRARRISIGAVKSR